MATLIQAIETEVANLSTPTRFEFEKLDVANGTIFDKLTVGDFPVCLLVPFNPSIRDREHPRSIMEATVEIFILSKMAGATYDRTAEDIKALIEPLHALGHELINRLDLNDVIEDEGITTVDFVDAFEAVGDATLYGPMITFNIVYSEDLNVCIS